MSYGANRGLPERAKLKFYFPQEGGAPSLTVEMPFFENPTVRERKRARYKTYSLISRSSDMYAYLGAESRKIDLEFFISLPHIMQEYPWVNEGKFMGPSTDVNNSKLEKEKFKAGPAGSSAKENKFSSFFLSEQYKSLKNSSTVPNTAGVQKEGMMAAMNTMSIVSPLGGGFNEFIVDGAIEQHQDNAYKNVENKEKIVDMIQYWINIIRSSVTNSADNPTLGPPVIRFSHGIMYRNVPCICKEYDVEWEEKMGYEIATLLPRRIKISMRLEELRTGDYGDYIPGDIVKGDNLAGWEAVIAHGSSDPGGVNLGDFTSTQVMGPK